MQPPTLVVTSAIVPTSRGIRDLIRIIAKLLFGRRHVIAGPRRIRLGTARASLLVELNRPARPGTAVTALRLRLHAAFSGIADVVVGILEILPPDPRRRLPTGLLLHDVLPVARVCGSALATLSERASDVPRRKCGTNQSDPDLLDQRDRAGPVKTPA
jgi:hypothetical protein